MVEGTFDKQRYGWRVMRREPFVGLCAEAHPFAGQSVPFDAVLSHTLLVREEGSGTRAVLQQVLAAHSCTLESFVRVHCISNFEAMKTLLAAGCGITFAYRAVLREHDGLAAFTLCEEPVERAFHFVFLPHTGAEALLDALGCGIL